MTEKEKENFVNEIMNFVNEHPDPQKSLDDVVNVLKKIAMPTITMDTKNEKVLYIMWRINQIQHLTRIAPAACRSASTRAAECSSHKIRSSADRCCSTSGNAGIYPKYAGSPTSAKLFGWVGSIEKRILPLTGLRDPVSR